LNAKSSYFISPKGIIQVIGRVETRPLCDVTWPIQGNLTEGGILSKVDLLVQTSLDQLLFMLKAVVTLLENKYLTRRSMVLSLPLQSAFHGLSYFGFGVSQTVRKVSINRP
jgi:hypothetical protein